MCPYCESVPLVDKITSPKHYEQVITSITKLIQEKQFILVDGTCPLGHHQVNHKWVDDIIYHVIQCPKCQQAFTCVVNTYRGGGQFKKGR